MAQESSFTDMLLNSLKDAFDQLTSDVGKGRVGNIYEQLTRGPTPLGKLPLANLQRMLPSIDPSVAAHIPQTYRKLGLERQGGTLLPVDFAAKLMEQGNYPRFKQLIENLTRKKLGPEFEAYRGFGLNDPLAGAVTKGVLPPATAVTTLPAVAKSFMEDAADMGIPGVTAKMKATPESVLGILPKRGTPFGREAELVIDPRWVNQFGVIEQTQPGGTGDLMSQVINDLLAKPLSRQIPGSGAAALTSGKPPPPIVETLMKALEAASKPPVTSTPNSADIALQNLKKLGY